MAIDSDNQAALQNYVPDFLRTVRYQSFIEDCNDATIHLIWILLVCFSNTIRYEDHLFQKWPTASSLLASIHRRRRHNPYPDDRKNSLIPS
jgi:hypothetical protein